MPNKPSIAPVSHGMYDGSDGTHTYQSHESRVVQDGALAHYSNDKQALCRTGLS